MNQRGFLLGLYATGAQVLLLRELVSSFHGNELFVGTALFGWILWAALGAFIGGATVKLTNPIILFLTGAVILPVTIIAVRTLPLTVVEVTGQIIPFGIAALFSIGLSLPIALISGWLFTAIARVDSTAREAIIRVYLFEGFGAFIGGIMVLMLTGNILSTLGAALTLSVVIIGCYLWFISGSKISRTVIILSALLLLISMPAFSAFVDLQLDRLKYKSYNIETTFDTRYAHQAILSIDSSLVLVTDNTIEAVQPDRATAENRILPPLVYNPGTKRILFFGRNEFNIADLIDSLNGISLDAVDPRERLTEQLERDQLLSSTGEMIPADPLSFVAQETHSEKYDIVIIPVSDLDSYRNSRFLTEWFLAKTKNVIKPGGVVFFPTNYDTDRYISADQTILLSSLYNVLHSSFEYIHYWPGTTTLFFASDSIRFDISYDSMISRLNQLPLEPQFISDSYLADRLDPIKTERLKSALTAAGLKNSLEKPILAHLQALYRAHVNSFDENVLHFLLRKQSWLVALAVVIFLFWLIVTFFPRKENRTSRSALFLLFTAGVVSLSLELVSFYVYQSSVGSLYSELAILIGVFMLGLALGTYATYRWGKPSFGIYSLIILITTSWIFLSSYSSALYIQPFIYHLMFLLIVAIATGALFVAAIDMLYKIGQTRNRGAGYSCELVGSSMGALLSITILLPVLGLPWLLISLVAMLTLALVSVLINGT